MVVVDQHRSLGTGPLDQTGVHVPSGSTARVG
jgi:hypothetical protein